MVTGASFVTTPSLYAKPVRSRSSDFEPISLIAIAPNVLVVHPSLPAKTVKELIALAKARPGRSGSRAPAAAARRISRASSSRRLTRSEMVHIPYRGTGPAIKGS